MKRFLLLHSCRVVSVAASSSICCSSSYKRVAFLTEELDEILITPLYGTTSIETQAGASVYDTVLHMICRQLSSPSLDSSEE
jgi:hypothetical protein